MDVTELISWLNKPWDGVENPATKFVRDDALECQLIKAQLPPQQGLRRALAQATFKATGKYDMALCEFNAKVMINKTFANFCPFIVNEYAKCNKACDVAKSVGFCIANAATDAKLMEEAAKQALAYVAIANMLKEGQNNWMEKMMNMFSEFLKKLPGTQSNITG